MTGFFAAAVGCPLSRKLAGNLAKKMEGRRTALLQSVALVPVTPKSAKSSLDSPGNPGESRGSQGKRNRSSHYTSPSLELKSRGRPYQPTKEDHSITFASFSPHSKASLPVPPSLACLLASRLITRPPSLLLPTFFLSIRGSLPPLSLDNPIIRPFFSARKTFLFRRFKDNRARLEAIEHPLVEIRLYTRCAFLLSCVSNSFLSVLSRLSSNKSRRARRIGSRIFSARIAIAFNGGRDRDAAMRDEQRANAWSSLL